MKFLVWPVAIGVMTACQGCGPDQERNRCSWEGPLVYELRSVHLEAAQTAIVALFQWSPCGGGGREENRCYSIDNQTAATARSSSQEYQGSAANSYSGSGNYELAVNNGASKLFLAGQAQTSVLAKDIEVGALYVAMASNSASHVVLHL